MKWTEKLKNDPELRKSFDKGITAGIILASVFYGLLTLMILIFV